MLSFPAAIQVFLCTQACDVPRLRRDWAIRYKRLEPGTSHFSFGDTEHARATRWCKRKHWSFRLERLVSPSDSCVWDTSNNAPPTVHSHVEGSDGVATANTVSHAPGTQAQSASTTRKNPAVPSTGKSTIVSVDVAGTTKSRLVHRRASIRALVCT